MAELINTEEWIKRAKASHYNRYDYTKVEYVNAKTKVVIICHEHGEFEQRPRAHIKGQGCPKCGGAIKLNSNEFIAEANKIHNNIYSYTKVNYKNNKTKVVITCPLHGDFLQAPHKHIHAKQGCPKCGKLSMCVSQSSNTEEFISKAKIVHGCLYNYDKTNYINSSTKIIITCPEHGDFEQTPGNHLSGGGCEKCGEIRTGLSKRSNTYDFINKAKKVHNAKYLYDKVNYIKAAINVTINCPKHGDFSTTPNSHLSGQGCPDCASSGFNKNKPAYLYYLKITTDDNNVLYKIGITNRTVNERFQITDLQKIEIIKQKLYEVGSEALEWENKLKRLYKQYQYKGPNILSSGNTELFTEDIIAMWYSG